MKTQVIGKDGKPGKEINLPGYFSSNIREDTAQKYFEAMKTMQAYGPFVFAGMLYSAAGKIRHMRHKWKTAYGHGISRVPRKIFWRRGNQFYWQGATVSGTKGGRAAHPPKPIHFAKLKKINKKERIIALKSAIAATASPVYLKRRYSTLNKEMTLPIIISSDLLKEKTKELANTIKQVLGVNKKLAFKNDKQVGILIVTGNDENLKLKVVEVRKVKELRIRDLWPLGRITMYTEKALEDLNKLLGEKK